ncbi:MAG: ABC transporter substrate-binding protein [Azospirillaceae bacterium]|nr:ABC transporter substrate-binding protein [Azospirillaceae bacterium]
MPQKSSRSRLAALAVCAGAVVGANQVHASELVFWSVWNEPEPQAVALRKIMSAYSQKHPETSFKVVWNGRQNQTKLRGALQAGIPVDLMDADADQLAGGLQMDGLGYDLTGELTGETKSAFLPGVLDLYAVKGHYIQFPYIYNTVNFWYNKDLLKKVGGSVPATFDELLSLCRTTRKAGKDALVIEGNVGFYNVLYFSNYLERLKGSGAVVKAFEDKSGAGWSDPAVLAAAKASRAVWDAGCIAADAPGFQYPAGQQTIAQGDTLGELVASWLPTELSESTGKDFSWGAFNFPAVADGKGKATDLEVGLLSFMVLKNSAHPKEAASFLNDVIGEDSQKILVAEGGVGVPRRGVAWPAALADGQTAAANATALSPFGGGLTTAYPEFTSNVLHPEFNKMFLGKTTPEEFVSTLVAKTKEYWDSHK